MNGRVEDAAFDVPDSARVGGAIISPFRPRSSSSADETTRALESGDGVRYEPFPLTPIQEAYWVGATGAFDLGGVPCQVYLELEGAGVNPARLRETWNRMVERHDMLRAKILPNGLQVVRRLEEMPEHFRVEDLSAPDVDTESALAGIRREMETRSNEEPDYTPVQICVALLPGGRHRVCLSFDFMFVDFSSVFILAIEWRSLYEDPEAELTPIEMSYRDYVLAIRDNPDPHHEAARDYWSERAATLPPGPSLPRPGGGNLLGGRPLQLRGDLEEATWQRLLTRAEEAGLSKSGVLLAAFSRSLSRWSADPRFTINLTVARRRQLHEQVNQLVGEFTMVTLLEVDDGEARPFIDHAALVQQRFKRDIQNSAFSGVEVGRLAASKQGWTGAPANVVFTSLLTPSSGEKRGLAYLWGWIGDNHYESSRTPQVAIDHQVVQRRDGRLGLRWDVREGTFPEGVAESMFEEYLALLQSLADTDAAWEGASQPTGVRAPAPMDGCAELLHEGFERVASAQPDCVAVIDLEGQHTYREVEERANRVARALRGGGVVANQLVPVVVKKGWLQVVSTLAILKAGAAYLPIDPDLPDKRKNLLLQKSGATTILAESSDAERRDWAAGVEVHCVDDRRFAEGDASWLPAPQTPTDLAYVIYTSGSTGEPKGVMIDHRGALNTILAINERLGVCSEDRVFALSSLSFDLSVYDIFGPLSVGASLVVPPHDATRDPRLWHEWLDRHDVTIWNSVPALMELLVEEIRESGSHTAGRLRSIMLSGDWIPVDLPGRIRRHYPSAALTSLGGATEASIWSIAHPIDTVDTDQASIPYGRALPGQSVMVLDDRMAQRPPWAIGEIYIGGAGVAKGYWRDAELTESRFPANPRTGETLYRTGDLGRLLPDGVIEILGRKDFQVKIQGHRIELGEIESTLVRHEEVGAAAVTTFSRSPSAPKQLVAFVVPAKQPVGDEPAGPILDELQKIDFKTQRRGLRRDVRHETLSFGGDLEDAVLLGRHRTRRTHREFASEPPLLVAVGRLLSNLVQIEYEREALPKARYPSAGDLYPVQVYVHLRPGAFDELPEGGFFYHDPVGHGLRSISPGGGLEAGVHAAHNRDAFGGSSFSIFLVAQKKAIEPIYGGLSRDFCLIEAGAMLQLLMDSAVEEQLGLCPIGALDFSEIRGKLDLDDSQELLHSLVGGKAQPVRDGVRVRSVVPELESAASSQSLERELKRRLADELPGYMVPTRIVEVEQLPLSSNGKVDRSALNTTDIEAEGAPFAPPENGLEETILEVARDAIGVDKIGIDDNLFDTGATSVDIVRIHRRIRSELGREFPVVTMFRHPTIRSLALALDLSESDCRSQEDTADRVCRRRAASRRRSKGRGALQAEEG